MRLLLHCDPPERPAINVLRILNGTLVVGPPDVVQFVPLLNTPTRQLYQSVDRYLGGQYHYRFVLDSVRLDNGEYMTHLAAALLNYEHEPELTYEIARTIGVGADEIEPTHYYLADRSLPLCSLLYENKWDIPEAVRRMSTMYAPTVANRIEEWVENFRDDYNRSGWYILQNGILL